jgi:hypothetical protein
MNRPIPPDIIEEVDRFIDVFKTLNSGKKTEYVSRELNDTADTLQFFEKNYKVPSLKHSYALTLKLHGSYDNLDQFKHDVPMYQSLLSNSQNPAIDAKIKNLKKRELQKLPTDVIVISAAPINFPVFSHASKNEHYLPLIKQLHYNGVLDSLNREKQLVYISNELRNIYINDLKEANQKLSKNMETYKRMMKIAKSYESALTSKIAELKEDIKYKQNAIKHAYQHFNIHHFKKGETTEKYLQESHEGPEQGMGIISEIEDEELFMNYVINHSHDTSRVMKTSRMYFISLDNFINDMYSHLKIKPDYFVIIDFTCNPVQNNRMSLNNDNAAEYVKQFHKRTHGEFSSRKPSPGKPLPSGKNSSRKKSSAGKRSFDLSRSRRSRKVRSLPSKSSGSRRRAASIRRSALSNRSASRHKSRIPKINAPPVITTPEITTYVIKPEYKLYLSNLFADINIDLTPMNVEDKLENYDLETLYKTKHSLFYKNKDPMKEPLVLYLNSTDKSKIHLNDAQARELLDVYV